MAGRMQRGFSGLVVVGLLLAGSAVVAGAQTSAAISGTVTEAVMGRPLGGICVSTFSPTGEEPVHATTDAAGAYTLPNLAAGLYYVWFNICDDGRTEFAGEMWRAAYGEHVADVISLAPGERLAGIDAALRPAAAITGRVTDDATGAPVGGICVDAWNESLLVGAGAVTDDRGAYAISTTRGSGLPEGGYQLFFSDCNEVPRYLYETYPGYDRHPERHDTDPAEVWAPAGGSVRADYTLTLGAAVTGRTTLSHTGHDALTCVTVESVDGAECSRMVYTAPGSFVAGSLPAGQYRVAFDPTACGGTGSVAEWYDDAADPAGASVLDLRPGDILDIEAVLTPRPSWALFCEEDWPPPLPFGDVAEGSAHAGPIACLASSGVVNGRGAGRYEPARPVTRGQFASMLVRGLDAQGVGLPDATGVALTDIGSSLHADSIERLAAAAILRGRADGRFHPDAPVTRGQLASVLVRTHAATTGLELIWSGDRFVDDQGHLFEHHIDLAAGAALVRGRHEGTFAPDGHVRRDQAASFVNHLLGRVGRDLAGPSED